MAGGLVSAVRTLTVLPIPGKDAERMTASLIWFPAVGALLGGILFGLIGALQAVSLFDWPGGTALVVVATAAMLTRGLHLDGLADAADGLFSMTSRSRTLEIMKDSRIGTFGVLALLFILAFKWAAVERLAVRDAAILVIPAFVVSRAAMVELAASLPYAREAGGTGAPFVQGASPYHRIVAWALALLFCAAAGPVALVAVPVGYLLVKILGCIYRKRLGGVTGDLLGASCEIVETALSVAAAAALPVVAPYAAWGDLPW